MNAVSKDLKDNDPERYWEERYQNSSPETSSTPGTALERFAAPLKAGRALELGCAKGDDAVWLAKSGWTVLAADISSTALDYAAGNAGRAGVHDRITFEQHKLPQTFPEGRFDLVVASFLSAQPRADVFRRATDTTVRGGHLLIIDHASRVPWSTAPADPKFPSAEENLTALALDKKTWARNFVGELERKVRDRDGSVVRVRDSIIFLQRQ